MTLNHYSQTFELLTPAWAGGATPELSAEIRVPTIRGHLRQWLRLLHPNQNLDDAIFGSVAEGGVRSSRVQLRLQAPVVSADTKDFVTYSQRGLEDEGYFLWPLRPGKKRGVIMPGPASKFTLHTRWYPLPGNPSVEHQQALNNAQTAFSLLGSMGTRSTRGYGSIWNTSHSFQNESDLPQTLSFLPTNITVRLLEGSFDDGRKALAAAARWMRSLRVGSDTYGASTDEGRYDHDVADPAQTPRGNAVVYRQALGMPLAQRFRRNGDTTVVQSKYRIQPNAPDNDRYPSPVRVKVIKLGGKYRVLIVILRSLLLPAGTAINLSNHRTAILSHDLITKIASEGTAIH